MAFEVPVAADFEVEQFGRKPDGHYHGVLHEVEEDGGDKGECLLTFEILMADDPNYVGQRIEYKLPKDIKMVWKIHRAAQTLHMITDDELKRLKAEGRVATYDFPATIGAQVHLDLHRQKKDEKYQDVTLYKLEDPYCSKWPKNAGWVSRSGLKMPTAPAAGTSNGTKPANGAPAATPPVNLAGVV